MRLARSFHPVPFILALVALCGCVEERSIDVPSHRYLDRPPTVTVLIAERVKSIACDLPESSLILRGGKVLKCKSAQSTVLTATKNRVAIAGKDTGFKVITLVSPEHANVVLEKTEYPDQITLMAERGELSAVNVVDLEKYVAGVIAGEMPLEWNDNALRAQAVAARTYALYEKKRWSTKRSFDLYADERSQMFVGATRNDKALRAASATRGVVLTSQWQIFPTYYHSSCGGHTRRAFPDFESERYTPLTGVPCPFCDFHDSAWKATLTEGEIRRALRLTRKITNIRLQDTRKGPAVRIDYEGGAVAYLTDDFRRAVGQRKLRSWHPAVQRSGDGWTFSGKGFGHGVGLCQWGACGMAKKGYAWPSILEYYYPGADTIRVY